MDAATNTCAEAPALEPEYAFTVSRDDEGIETYEYLNDPSRSRMNIKVTSGGGGLCEGGVELFSADGRQILNFKPTLLADGSIVGQGEYDLYASDQW